MRREVWPQCSWDERARQECGVAGWMAVRGAIDARKGVPCCVAGTSGSPRGGGGKEREGSPRGGGGVGRGEGSPRGAGGGDWRWRGRWPWVGNPLLLPSPTRNRRSPPTAR